MAGKRKRQQSKARRSRRYELYTAAVGGKNSHGPRGYVALDVTNAPVRPTRKQAMADWLLAYGMDD